MISILKILVFIILYTGFSFHLSAMDVIDYETINRSIVILHQQIILDGSKSSEKSLWNRVEKFRGSPLIDTPLSIASGTGFFIDAEGSILTNHHVAVIEDEEQALKDLVNAFQQYISYEIPRTVLSTNDQFKLRMDVSKLLKASHIYLYVETAQGELMDTDLLASDAEKDLALLRIKTKEPSPIVPIDVEQNNIRSGASVYAFGYPLQYFFDTISVEPRMIMTNGIVSAIREGTWGIQHTAALNPGSSGGPLINDEGYVVGVNVGEVQNTNSMFFSIGLDTVSEFLLESGFISMLDANIQLSKKAIEPDIDIQADLGTITIRTNPPARLVINGIARGITPLKIELPAGDHLLQFRLEGYTIDDRIISIEPGVSLNLNIDAQPLVKISLDPPPPPGTKLTVTNPEKTLYFLDPSIIQIPEGIWHISVRNDKYLKPVDFDLNTKNLSIINTTAWFETGKLLFQNIAAKSTLYIDDINIGQIYDGQRLDVTCGIREIRLTNKKYLEYTKSVKIQKKETVILYINQEFDTAAYRKRKLQAWGICTLALTAISVPSLAYGSYELMSHDPLDGDYEPSLYYYIGGYGILGASISGIIYLINLLITPE